MRSGSSSMRMETKNGKKGGRGQEVSTAKGSRKEKGVGEVNARRAGN